jgi:hypothetical protein
MFNKRAAPVLARDTREPGDCHQQMQKHDGQIAHRTSQQDCDTGEECSRILEFAMHKTE